MVSIVVALCRVTVARGIRSGSRVSVSVLCFWRLNGISERRIKRKTRDFRRRFLRRVR